MYLRECPAVITHYIYHEGIEDEEMEIELKM